MTTPRNWPDWWPPGSWPPGSRWIERPDHRPAVPHADDSERTVTPIYGPRGDVIAQVSNKPWVPCGFQPSERERS